MKLAQVTLREPLAIAGLSATGGVQTLRDCETCAEGVLHATPGGTVLVPWANVRHALVRDLRGPSESEQLADAALDRAAEAPKPKRSRQPR